MEKFHDFRTLLPSEDDGKLIIRWTAGHVGIPRNEQADEQAKMAAGGDTLAPQSLPNSLPSPPTLPASKSAIKQSFRESISEEARTVLRSSTRTRFKEIDPSFPFNRFAKIADKYPREQAALPHPASHRPHPPEQTPPQNIESTLPDLSRL
ncbi:hypothetical protein BDR04DRAFT_1085686 [Suillus decipiens]|nr:hypothetical protein BDR04DRAFT_1085686 [Suillus decipiens]